MPHGGVLSVPALHGLGLCVFADLADVYQLCGLLFVLGAYVLFFRDERS